MSGRRKHHDDPVVEITSAPTSPSEEIAHRERNYLISMGIRTICFIGGVVAISTGVVWLGIVLFVASLILPLFAVIVGNSVSPRLEGTPADPGLHHRELGPGRDQEEN
ncbi:MAG: DUF3099 domain-containing protein [Nocardioidaceae bacterium]|nr:DUF3099 domain-containing protein [Nocardioidaceae bacterium]